MNAEDVAAQIRKIENALVVARDACEGKSDGFTAGMLTAAVNIAMHDLYGLAYRLDPPAAHAAEERQPPPEPFTEEELKERTKKVLEQFGERPKF